MQTRRESSSCPASPSGCAAAACVRACVRACVATEARLVPRQVLFELGKVDVNGEKGVDGTLDFEEFSHAVAHSDIRAKLTIERWH